MLGASSTEIIAKYGKLVKNPGISVKNYSVHSMERMAEREVDETTIGEIVRDGIAILQGESKYLIVKKYGAVVIDETGNIITVWLEKDFTDDFKLLIKALNF